MQLLVFVLNKVDRLEDLLKELLNVGIKGATVLESTGMARVLHDAIPIFGSLKMLVNQGYSYSKTVFVVLKDDQVKLAIDSLKQVVGDLYKPDVGILFTIPLNQVEGGNFS
ncbi:MAG TPA: hypothetical protein DDW93_06325 [Firmicutes bacterium]|jgi:nitrogen regulatory protein PII|nr:hypothetical protein [Bacillota bacterium]HBK69801.1 hypothetical protein [Bacillota bacterium]HBT18123.1 hypothetical protein [Bacillota bacterium]